MNQFGIHKLLGQNPQRPEKGHTGETMSNENTWQGENERGARLYQHGRYAEAEQAFRTALQAAEHCGPTDTRVALVLNNLASLCHNQRHLAEAQARYQRALALRRQAYGPHHPVVAQSLNNLAAL